jgi:hypothetical protein
MAGLPGESGTLMVLRWGRLAGWQLNSQRDYYSFVQLHCLDCAADCERAFETAPADPFLETVWSVVNGAKASGGYTAANKLSIRRRSVARGEITAESSVEPWFAECSVGFDSLSLSLSARYRTGSLRVLSGRSVTMLCACGYIQRFGDVYKTMIRNGEQTVMWGFEAGCVAQVKAKCCRVSLQGQVGLK